MAASKQRGPGRPFPKGVSGNPGGRPKGLARPLVFPGESISLAETTGSRTGSSRSLRGSRFLWSGDSHGECPFGSARATLMVWQLRATAAGSSRSIQRESEGQMRPSRRKSFARSGNYDRFAMETREEGGRLTGVRLSGEPEVPYIGPGWHVQHRRWPPGSVAAYTGEAEHSDRPIVNAPIGARDRSGVTLAGRSAVELALLSP